MDNSEGLKALLKEVTVNAIKITQELKLGMEPKDVPAMLQSHDKAFTNEKLLLMGEQGE